MKSEISRLQDLYRTTLLDDVIPFWLQYSPDYQSGGYFTCLNRQGEVYDTDKFIWLQARQVWTFATLYNQVQDRSEWLDFARHGISFLTNFGRNSAGDWYFALNRDGQPLVEPYNIFSDCFAAMALSAYSLAADHSESAKLAKLTYQRIMDRKDNPKGRWEKKISSHRPLKGLAIPMILCNLALELEHLLSPNEVEYTIDWCLNEIMNQFLDREQLLVHENILPDGKKADCFDGRLINPGHGIEAMWFVLDISRRRMDSNLREQVLTTLLRMIDFGWDREHGGIFYFLDSQGQPTQQLEWDQKLWWVHLEALVGLLMAFNDTGDEKYWKWFRRIHDYSWSHFPDPSYGEWYGYLSRDGEVLLPLKGGKWKGCFHLPRALLRCYQELVSIGGQYKEPSSEVI